MFYLQFMKTKILVAFIFLINSAFSQLVTDTELWQGNTLKVELNKKLRLDIDQQFRLHQTASNVRVAFTQFGLKYEINKAFSVAPAYRISIPNGGVMSDRYQIDGNYKWKKKDFPLSIGYRARFQNEVERLTRRPNTKWRNKLSLEANLSKLVDPFVSSEIFFRFNGRNEFRDIRFTLGLDWKLTKDLDFTTFYRFQREINVNLPQGEYVIGLMLGYKIGIKKEKEKDKKKN